MINFLIALTHAINYFHRTLTHYLTRKIDKSIYVYVVVSERLLVIRSRQRE